MGRPRKPPEERQQEHVEEELERRFGSMIVFSVKVLRPMEQYPYERAVWDSEIRVKVGANPQEIDTVTKAWLKTMEAGVEVCSAINAIERADSLTIEVARRTKTKE